LTDVNVSSLKGVCGLPLLMLVVVEFMFWNAKFGLWCTSVFWGETICPCSKHYEMFPSNPAVKWSRM